MNSLPDAHPFHLYTVDRESERVLNMTEKLRALSPVMNERDGSNYRCTSALKCI